MKTLKIIIIFMAVLLIVSIGANVYFASSLTTPNNNDVTRLGMVSALSQVQVNINKELQKIGSSLALASQKLTSTGLTGTQADAVLSELASNSTYIIDAGTQDMNNIMVAVQPSAYSNVIGMNIGEQTWLNTNPNGPITPMMTPVIPLIENTKGVAMAAPVFNTDKEMIGTVSIIFNPQQLVSTCIAQSSESAKYEFSVMQTDGYCMYDSEPEYQGQNLLTNTSIIGYSLIHTSVSNTANNISGYYLYDYQGTNWQCYWTTINAFGQDWRLSVHHTA
ncbi:MAG: hypothetical protein ACQCN5_03415 [Candidatus Bathyarchaeia archaeon]|jgi:hypothetical protein